MQHFINVHPSRLFKRHSSTLVAPYSIGYGVQLSKADLTRFGFGAFACAGALVDAPCKRSAACFRKSRP
jgi:hypothetical protein